MSADDIDITLYGASGFTGGLIAEYLAERSRQDPTFTWALAGRNAEKLDGVHSRLGLDESTAVIVADGDDQAALTGMAERSRVVIAAAGPYQLYGSKVVAACARTGTDYVDLCGEPNWMRAMIDEHSADAERTGARIVFSCGFDSVPFDLGVFVLESLALEHFGSPISRVKGRVLDMRGSASGGTVASMMATMSAAGADPEVAMLLVDPFALTPSFAGPEQPAGTVPVLDEDLGTWAAPFVMAIINTKVVHRTNALLGHRYGADLRYDEMVVTGPGDEGEAAANDLGQTGGMLGGDGSLEPGDGPSREERDAGGYLLAFTGALDDGRAVRVTVAGDQDPGYGSTSKMIAESALCLLRDDVGTGGGIWTPAAAMGPELIERLRRRSVLTIEQTVTT